MTVYFQINSGIFSLKGVTELSILNSFPDAGNSFSSSILSFSRAVPSQSLICCSPCYYLSCQAFPLWFPTFLASLLLCLSYIFLLPRPWITFWCNISWYSFFMQICNLFSISFLITPHFTLLKTLTGDPFQKNLPWKEGEEEKWCAILIKQFIHLIDSRRCYAAESKGKIFGQWRWTGVRMCC